MYLISRRDIPKHMLVFNKAMQTFSPTRFIDKLIFILDVGISNILKSLF